MKVLHVATGFPFLYVGGITNYVRSLVISQRNAGHEVHVLSGGCSSENLEYVTNIYSKKIKPFSLKLSIEDEKYAKEVLNICREYDIVHFHMVLDFPSSLLSRLSKEIPKYVVSLHDYFLICPRIFMSDYKNNICHEVNIDKCNVCCGYFDSIDIARKISSKLSIPLPRIKTNEPARRIENVKTFLEGASLLLPVSEKVKEIYSKLVPNASYKVLHIGNITATELPLPKEENGKIIIGILGTLSYIKGSDIILKIIKQTTNKNIEFHFYGRADKKWLTRLEKYGLINKGTYVQENLKEIISTINLGLVVPIWEDNAPQVVMEFLNLKTPVLATSRGGIPDFIQHLVNGYLFDPDDQCSFQAFIAWINNLNRKTIVQLNAGVKKLKTPEQHEKEIDRVYHVIK
ncbi:glycosyltransferase, partial [Escherichia coli]|nr:glycosyltransferase [Escherichia coli]